jgi:hypothetical protein
MKPVAKSYLRHALIAVIPLLTVESTQWNHYAFAVTIAVIGPFIRLLDPNDNDIQTENDLDDEIPR